MRLVKSPGYFEFPHSLTVDEKTSLNDLISSIKGLENITGEDRLDIAKNILSRVMKTNIFSKAASNLYMQKYNENPHQVFKNSWHMSKLQNDIHVRYISTVNISAYAGNKMDIGNSTERIFSTWPSMKSCGCS